MHEMSGREMEHTIASWVLKLARSRGVTIARREVCALRVGAPRDSIFRIMGKVAGVCIEATLAGLEKLARFGWIQL